MTRARLQEYIAHTLALARLYELHRGLGDHNDTQLLSKTPRVGARVLYRELSRIVREAREAGLSHVGAYCAVPVTAVPNDKVRRQLQLWMRRGDDKDGVCGPRHVLLQVGATSGSETDREALVSALVAWESRQVQVVRVAVGYGKPGPTRLPLRALVHVGLRYGGTDPLVFTVPAGLDPRADTWDNPGDPEAAEAKRGWVEGQLCATARADGGHECIPGNRDQIRAALDLTLWRSLWYLVPWYSEKPPHGRLSRQLDSALDDTVAWCDVEYVLEADGRATTHNQFCGHMAVVPRPSGLAALLPEGL